MKNIKATVESKIVLRKKLGKLYFLGTEVSFLHFFCGPRDLKMGKVVPFLVLFIGPI